MSFPRYPAYKDSGVEWLGSVPEHWRVDRLKASITSCRNGIWGDEAQDDENDIPCVRVADFDRQKLHVRLQQPTIRNVTEKERTNRVLKRGDLLLEKSGGGENQPVGCVMLYDDDQPAVCSNFVAKVELGPGMDSSYWRYVHAAAYAVRLTVGSINQTSGIQNLDQDRYFNERAAFPSEQEQTAIGEFLDRETAKIDALVAEQEQLITLLKEKRQAVISHAVTKGLDPSVPMKDSGVEWLGEVPSHWVISRLKSISPEVTVGVVVEPSKYYCDEGIPALRSLNVTPMAIRQEGYVYFSTESNDLLAKSKLRAGDLVAVRSGQPGTTAVVPDELDGCNCIDLIIIRKPLVDDARFMAWYLNSDAAVHQFTEGSGGAIQQHFNVGTAMNLLLTRPPVEEQRKIVAEIEKRIQEIDQLLSEALLSIELLRERRSALISAAVTGQIDVRGLVMDKEAA